MTSRLVFTFPDKTLTLWASWAVSQEDSVQSSMTTASSMGKAAEQLRGVDRNTLSAFHWSVSALTGEHRLMVCARTPGHLLCFHAIIRMNWILSYLKPHHSVPETPTLPNPSNPIKMQPTAIYNTFLLWPDKPNLNSIGNVLTWLNKLSPMQKF